MYYELHKHERTVSPWRITSWICCGVIVISVVSCVILAAVRSEGLTKVKVTALEGDKEPRDHGLPLINQKDVLPDYEIIIMTQDGTKTNLGAKPNTSAVEGLTWVLNHPISITDIASVRLQDQDKIISDAITEVQVTDKSVVSGNYRFDFQTQRSAAVGVQSFFGTPIGLAIVMAFVIAIVLIIVLMLSNFIFV